MKRSRADLWSMNAGTRPPIPIEKIVFERRSGFLRRIRISSFFSLLFQLYFVFFLVPYRCVVRVSNSRHNRKSQTECMRFDLFGFDLWLSRRDQQHAAHTHRSQAEHTLTQEIELLYILFDSTNNSERRRRQWRRWKITHTRLNFNGIWFFLLRCRIRMHVSEMKLTKMYFGFWSAPRWFAS